MMLGRPLMPHFFLIAMGISASAVAACHPSEPTSPPSNGLKHPVDARALPQPGPGASRNTTMTTYNLWLGDSVMQMCKGPSPFFEFDTSDTAAKQQPTMQVLAACMQDGPLKGRSIRLVGHTDPRGTAEYNEKLGLERAERVKRYLVAQGTDASRILVDSAGEEAATGAPKDWPSDRRVEVQLVP